MATHPQLNAQNLIENPETGYLEARMGGGLTTPDAFDSRKKVKFIELARSGAWPRVGRICEAIGVSRQTYHTHLMVDPKFRQDIQNVKEAMCDDMEATLVENGTKPMGFLDRIALLKAYRGQLYNPDKRIILEHTDNLDKSEAEKRVARLRDVIDADVVETYQRKPERLEPKADN